MARLHLTDMREGMDGPSILGVQRDGTLGSGLGRAIVAHLLEAEGVHAEREAIARHLFIPGRQHARDAVAQAERIAHEEIADVRDLQREQIARVIDQHSF